MIPINEWYLKNFLPWKILTIQYIYTCNNYYTYTCMHVHKHKHTHTNTHTHTHTHTCIATDFVDKSNLKWPIQAHAWFKKHPRTWICLLNKIGVRDSYSYSWWDSSNSYTWCAKRLVHALLSVHQPYNSYIRNDLMLIIWCNDLFRFFSFGLMVVTNRPGVQADIYGQLTDQLH